MTFYLFICRILFMSSFLLKLIFSEISPITEVVFTPQEMIEWEEIKFQDRNHYFFDEGSIRVESSNSASGLFHYYVIDLTRTPWIEWEWKVEAFSTSATNADQEQALDDYPVRLYMIEKGLLLGINARVITYVWSRYSFSNTSWNNPYLNKFKMVAVNHPSDSYHIWVKVRRNVREDFNRFFKVNQKKLDGVAIMVDTDQSGGQATSWYRKIRFFTNPNQNR